jgi:hypothetical protein
MNDKTESDKKQGKIKGSTFASGRPEPAGAYGDAGPPGPPESGASESDAEKAFSAKADEKAKAAKADKAKADDEDNDEDEVTRPPRDEAAMAKYSEQPLSSTPHVPKKETDEADAEEEKD